ncbi:transglycosylase SLT domain-containing protein [Dyella flava]|uniref:Lytic transglycosylase domain-containing protein n=1 Tax=Dyella flava TaxID=1920170 RepID=A0ABS2K656_9GAMM|nr:transglycosylase SLT domain-containing protein [Dyella flava]MBM7126692.1 lytic transglycosylase domain-containing protein [Dyella flava]
MLLLQAPFDLNDENPPRRARRAADTGAGRRHADGGSSGTTGHARSRPPVTQRVLLCAPATFKGQRTGAIPVPHAQKILFVDPQGWASRRHVRIGMDRLTCSPCSARPMRAYSVAYGPSLPKVASDMSTVLLAARRHVKAYKQPTANTLAMAAGTAVVAIVTHYLHAQVLPPVVTSLSIERPELTVTVSPAMIEMPHLVATLSRSASRLQVGTPSFSVRDLQRLVTTLPVQSMHDDGFDLDITSPNSLWASAGARYRIDPLLIYAVALVESKSAQADGSIAPSPWVVRVNGRMHRGSHNDAVRAIEMAHQMALPVQDVGIMQVYYPVHKDIEPDPVALLNPVRNIEVGTRLLRKAMQESHDPVLRIGYYHSHDATLARGYGRAVLGVYRELKYAMSKSSSANVVALARAPMDASTAGAGG